MAVVACAVLDELDAVALLALVVGVLAVALAVEGWRLREVRAQARRPA